ncbi:MAG: fused MFS/spermidine synthase, partial [Planctomycetota bacterium]
AMVSKNRTIASQRNFFGVLRVREKPMGTCLVHGTTLHGMQRYAPHQSQPTTYYGYESGVGYVVQSMQKANPSLRIGVVGLGCGVLTTYGRENDSFDLIEINPGVVEIAKTYFTFMRDCPSKLTHHLGDGRLVLERMADTRFDVLVLDAFSSDAIPAHLLTREAMQLYRERLTDNGVLAIHTSNNHLELSPLVHRLSSDAGLDSRMIEGIGDESIGTTHSTWMVIAEHGHDVFSVDPISQAEPPTVAELAEAPLWTDQHHNLVGVLRLWQE